MAMSVTGEAVLALPTPSEWACFVTIFEFILAKCEPVALRPRPVGMRRA